MTHRENPDTNFALSHATCNRYNAALLRDLTAVAGMQTKRLGGESLDRIFADLASGKYVPPDGVGPGMLGSAAGGAANAAAAAAANAIARRAADAGGNGGGSSSPPKWGSTYKPFYLSSETVLPIESNRSTYQVKPFHLSIQTVLPINSNRSTFQTQLVPLRGGGGAGAGTRSTDG